MRMLTSASLFLLTLSSLLQTVLGLTAWCEFGRGISGNDGELQGKLKVEDNHGFVEFKGVIRGIEL